jgi:hypothetical protein
MMRRKKTRKVVELSILILLYVRFPTDHRSEMSPVVVYVLIVETKRGVMEEEKKEEEEEGYPLIMSLLIL